MMAIAVTLELELVSEIRYGNRMGTVRASIHLRLVGDCCSSIRKATTSEHSWG